MTRDEFLYAMVERTGLTGAQVSAATNAFMEIIKEVVISGDRISFPKFGAFSAKKQTTRRGVNPRTLKPIIIPATRHALFLPGRDLRALPLLPGDE